MLPETSAEKERKKEKTQWGGECTATSHLLVCLFIHRILSVVVHMALCVCLMIWILKREKEDREFWVNLPSESQDDWLLLRRSSHTRCVIITGCTLSPLECLNKAWSLCCSIISRNYAALSATWAQSHFAPLHLALHFCFACSCLGVGCRLKFTAK